MSFEGHLMLGLSILALLGEAISEPGALGFLWRIAV